MPQKYLNHEILDQYSDKSKSTLYKIAGVDLVVKDFLLVMPANTDFNLVDNSFSVFTVCMLSMSSTVQCVNDFEQSTLTSNDYAISTDQPLKVIRNSSSQRAVLRFTISK